MLRGERGGERLASSDALLEQPRAKLDDIEGAFRPQPATASTRPPNLKRDTSSSKTHLTPSEIESLRQESKDAAKIIRPVLAG